MSTINSAKPNKHYCNNPPQIVKTKRQKRVHDDSMLTPLNDSIPNDCWLMIEKFLTASDLVRFYPRTNKLCNSTWQERKFTQIHFPGTKITYKLVNLLKTEKFPNLKHFSTNQLTHELSTLLNKQDQLESLKSPISNNIALFMVPPSKSLKRFEAHRLPQRLPLGLPRLGITDYGIAQINNDLPNLEVLLLDQYPCITNAGLGELNIQSLKEVSLLNCEGFTVEGIISLIQRLPLLERLRLSPEDFTEAERKQIRETKPDLDLLLETSE